MSDDKLYLIGIMPPEPLYSKIDHVRIQFGHICKYREALKPPVHITLIPPFKISDTDVAEFERQIANMENLIHHTKPFAIEVNNYEFFDNLKYPVIFINVVKSIQLAELHRCLRKEMQKYPLLERKKMPFKSHFTIGYRDIDPNGFPAIKEAYLAKEFKDSFICDKFYLWKHNRKKWEVLKEFSLNGKETQLSLL